MKKAVLVIFVALMAMAILATPVLAKSPKKFTATLTEDVLALTANIVPGDTMVTPSGVVQVRGLGLDFMTGFTLSFNGQDIPICSSNSVDAVWNPKTQVMMWRSEAVWYADPASMGSANGFAGHVDTTWYGITNPENVQTASGSETHCTLQGFGEFAGDTLVLTAESHGAPSPWTGFIIIP